MARSGHGFHQINRGRVRGELAGLCIEGEHEDLVAAQRGDVDEFVALVDADRVRIAPHLNDLQRFRGHAPIAANFVDADDVATVGRTQQKAPGLVQRDIWEALRER